MNLPAEIPELFKTSQVVAALVGLTGAFIGFLLKAAWDLFISDRTCSTSKLLERFAAGTVSRAGRHRLALAGDDALRKWADNLSAREGRPDIVLVQCDSDQLVVRPRSIDQGFAF